MVDTTRLRMPFIEVPAGIMPTAANRSETYRILANMALKENLQMIMVDLGQIPSGTMFIHPVLLAKIEAIAKEFEISPQAAFAGLCAASVQKLQDDMKRRIKDEKVLVKGWSGATILKSDRPAQIKFHEKIRTGLSFNKIVLAEASTGVGKGRAMMAAAVEVAEEGKTPVIVAAPTINVMTQLFHEFEALCRESPEARKTTIAILPGRTEFVDSEKLISFLNDADLINGESPEDIQAITIWVEAGAPAQDSNEKNALVATMRGMGISPAWLMDDLRKITVNFPVDAFVLNSESDKEGESQVLLTEYKAKLTQDAKIILCTHAMLAIGQKNQWNPAILPQPSVLFVDEAHQLEQAIAQFNSEQLSLFSLRWRLLRFMKKNNIKSSSTIAGKALKQVKQLINSCRLLDSQDARQDVRLNNPQTEKEADDYAHILKQVTDIQKLIKSRSLDNLEEIKDDRKAFSAANLAIEKGGNYKHIHLTFSPTRNYPSLQVGVADMGPQLGHIWKSAEGGAVLASATLFVPEPDGSLRSDYIRYVLALPFSRIYEIAPIEAPYMYSIPTLHYPSQEKCKMLSPPKSQRGEARQQYLAEETEWLRNAAKEIYLGPASTAKGGTLILCTSYNQVDNLTNMLTELGVDRERIVPQERGKKFEFTKNEFIASHRAGRRPILIGLGSAWTGLDLLDKEYEGDENAHKDLLLTDEVILRAPLGINRSTTMLTRIEHRGTDPIIKEALLLFKQGLGRLIRRDKVKHRHLWIMDGRLWRQWDGMERFTGAARSILGKYKKTEVF